MPPGMILYPLENSPRKSARALRPTVDICISHTVIFGGVGQRPQELALDRGVDIVVAPGRLLDLMGQGHVDLSQVETFILDEADRMLDMGFIPDIGTSVCRRIGATVFSPRPCPRRSRSWRKILVNPVQVKIDLKNRRSIK